LYREYTDLSRRHESEVNARHKQQESHVDSLHSNITAAVAAAAVDDDDDDDTTNDRLSRMVSLSSIVLA